MNRVWVKMPISKVYFKMLYDDGREDNIYFRSVWSCNSCNTYYKVNTVVRIFKWSIEKLREMKNISLNKLW